MVSVESHLTIEIFNFFTSRFTYAVMNKKNCKNFTLKCLIEKFGTI